ncbi:MAG: MerR family transcriptional regulator [Acidobacteria bacterium]|nr:MAG: MerR family transcriptional regulator [Acidobacteriota bacterium]
MADDLIKSGALASRTGVSIRTLHHYDKIGLLTPHRSPSGHRLYDRRQVVRLQQIVSLRQIGLSLDEIRKALNRSEHNARRIIELHIARLKQRIEVQQDLCRRLEVIAARPELASIEEIIKTIEVMTMFEKYYTKEQLETLRKRAAELGEDHIHEVAAEWPKLIAEVRGELQRGTDPKDPRMQALAKRWNELVHEFTGGDPGITESLNNFYRGEPQFAAQQSLDGQIFDYVRKALRES